MNTITPAARAASAESFVALVSDILAETRDDATITNDQIVERLADAYVPRIAAERNRADDAEKTAAGLLARDRAIGETTAHLKGSITLLVDTNARVQAHLGHRVSQVEAMRTLVATAEQNGRAAVLSCDLREILDEPLFRLPTNPPVTVGIAADYRHSGGVFHEGSGRKHHFPFIGWGIVVHSIFMDSTIEPIFRTGNAVLSRTALAAAGYQLDALV